MSNGTASSEREKTSVFKFLDSYYRVTKYYGSNVLRLEELKKGRWGAFKYQTIYFGHLDPLDMAVSFFNRN